MISRRGRGRRRVGARSARASARCVGELLGVSIARDPEPAGAAAVPARGSRRDARAPRSRARARDLRVTGLDELLALRAVRHLPYRLLRAVSDDPSGRFLGGPPRALAAAELGVVRDHAVADARRGELDESARARPRRRRAALADRASRGSPPRLWPPRVLPSIEESQTARSAIWCPARPRRLDAELRSAELFGFPLLSRTIVVQRAPDGLGRGPAGGDARRGRSRVNRDTLPGLERDRRRAAGAQHVSVAPFTRERGTTAITYLYFTPDVGAGERLDLAERVRERAAAHCTRRASPASRARSPAREAQSQLISDRLPLVELRTVLLVVPAIGLHYRALLAPAITLGAIAVTYLLTVRRGRVVGERFGVAVPSEVQPAIVVLLFGRDHRLRDLLHLAVPSAPGGGRMARARRRERWGRDRGHHRRRPASPWPPLARRW